MLRPRVIPCLLVHRGGLVKTQGFKDPKYVGDPINAVKIFNEKEADELMVLDIDASATGAEPNYGLIAKLAVECRMPLCYGGGITTAAQAKHITSLGVEKVALSAAAVADPTLVTRIAEEIGRQSVVVVLDVKKRLLAREPEVWTHNAQRNTKRSVFEVAQQMQDHGAGEIVVNSIDEDGRMAGYDLALARRLRASLRVPLTVLGGAGSLEHIAQLIDTCGGLVGAAAGSLFVFKGKLRAVLINYPSTAQRDALPRLGG